MMIRKQETVSAVGKCIESVNMKEDEMEIRNEHN